MERFNYKRPWDEGWFDIYDDDILGDSDHTLGDLWDDLYWYSDKITDEETWYVTNSDYHNTPWSKMPLVLDLVTRDTNQMNDKYRKYAGRDVLLIDGTRGTVKEIVFRVATDEERAALSPEKFGAITSPIFMKLDLVVTTDCGSGDVVCDEVNVRLLEHDKISENNFESTVASYREFLTTVDER